MELILEVNKNCLDKTSHYVVKNNQWLLAEIMVSPITSEDYWMFRVKLCKDQAVLGFPKIGLIGVGMAQEKNENINLPLFLDCSSQEDAKRIANHIKRNKKYKSITYQMIVDAIVLIHDGAIKYKKYIPGE